MKSLGVVMRNGEEEKRIILGVLGEGKRQFVAAEELGVGL